MHGVSSHDKHRAENVWMHKNIKINSACNPSHFYFLMRENEFAVDCGGLI